MIGEPYPFLDKHHNREIDILFYVFISQGDLLIPKGIIYAPLEKHGQRYYNWGFGDLILNEQTGEYTVSMTNRKATMEISKPSFIP